MKKFMQCVHRAQSGSSLKVVKSISVPISEAVYLRLVESIEKGMGLAPIPKKLKSEGLVDKNGYGLVSDRFLRSVFPSLKRHLADGYTAETAEAKSVIIKMIEDKAVGSVRVFFCEECTKAHAEAGVLGYLVDFNFSVKK